MKSFTADEIFRILETVADPEIPVLSILDLGIVRAVNLNGEIPEIVVTPTYSGCPATDAINTDIRLKMMEYGLPKIKITTRLSPAWTTDWMSQAGKKKLEDYGIAPPKPANREITCPRCKSPHVTCISHFGSTACKSLYQCLDCKEPFDYFKCH
ncbi:MAG: phenylacetate-CoA oxygenase subunit PaaJ [Bacteroidetes bacterium]|nr:phenylacetate-CoA oxygenase subunit PaaJ [Bacteroidota bacterium]